MVRIFTSKDSMHIKDAIACFLKCMVCPYCFNCYDVLYLRDNANPDKINWYSRCCQDKIVK